MTRKTFSALLALLLIGTLLTACAQAPAAPSAETTLPPQSVQSPPVRMLAVNVGKADALIIQAGGLNFLVDSGLSKTYGQLEEALKWMQIDRLDAVFLTHTDKDHGGGLKKLAASDMPIGAWYASAYYVDKTHEKHQAVVASGARGQAVTFLKAGDEVAVSDAVRFEVIGPVELAPDSENNNSLVMILHTPEGKILLTGDMQIQEELSVLKTGKVQACEVLKVGHHGDDTASSYNLLSAVRPQIAVISTSTLEEKDTPAGTVLLSLKKVGAQTFVTQNASGGVLVGLSGFKATAEYVSFE